MKKKIVASFVFICAAPLFIFRDALGIHFCQDELNQCLMVAPFILTGAAAIKFKGQQIMSFFGRKPVHTHPCHHDHDQDRCG